MLYLKENSQQYATDNKQQLITLLDTVCMICGLWHAHFCNTINGWYTWIILVLFPSPVSDENWQTAE